MSKLNKLGIIGVALSWLASYLENRKQAVEIKYLKKMSVFHHFCHQNIEQYRVNVCCVPQGSFLGPLLFLLNINDLPDITQHECILFADDISVVIPSKNDLTTN